MSENFFMHNFFLRVKGVLTYNFLKFIHFLCFPLPGACPFYRFLHIFYKIYKIYGLRGVCMHKIFYARNFFSCVKIFFMHKIFSWVKIFSVQLFFSLTSCMLMHVNACRCMSMHVDVKVVRGYACIKMYVEGGSLL